MVDEIELNEDNICAWLETEKGRSSVKPNPC